MAKVTKEKVQEEAKSKLQETMDRLNKAYGTGSVMTLGTADNGQYDVISTGSLGLDWICLGIGGGALGRLYEVRGWEGVGKSTLCANMVANCQKSQFKGRKGKAAYLDGEHAVNRPYFEKLGICVDEMIFSQPNTGEEGFDIAENLIKSGEIDLLIIDSDSSFMPKSMIEAPVQDVSKVGKKASLNSTAYPRLKNLLSDYKVCIVVISQYREKLGVMYGDPKITQGGHALKYSADVILEMSKTLIKNSDGTEVYGNETKVKALKNKMHPPHIPIKFDILFNEGIDKMKEVIEFGVELGAIQKGGAGWYTVGETKIQGEDKLKEFMRDNTGFYQEIEQKVMALLNPSLVTIEK